MWLLRHYCPICVNKTSFLISLRLFVFACSSSHHFSTISFPLCAHLHIRFLNIDTWIGGGTFKHSQTHIQTHIKKQRNQSKSIHSFNFFYCWSISNNSTTTATNHHHQQQCHFRNNCKMKVKRWANYWYDQFDWMTIESIETICWRIRNEMIKPAKKTTLQLLFTNIHIHSIFGDILKQTNQLSFTIAWLSAVPNKYTFFLLFSLI